MRSKAVPCLEPRVSLLIDFSRSSVAGAIGTDTDTAEFESEGTDIFSVSRSESECSPCMVNGIKARVGSEIEFEVRYQIVEKVQGCRCKATPQT